MATNTLVFYTINFINNPRHVSSLLTVHMIATSNLKLCNMERYNICSINASMFTTRSCAVIIDCSVGSYLYFYFFYDPEVTKSD